MRQLAWAFVAAGIGVAGCGNPPPSAAEHPEADSTPRESWDMKAYQFVTLTRHPNPPELDSARMGAIMQGHLAHLDSLHAIGIIRLVGPFGDERDLRGFALLDVADSAAAMAEMNRDPSVAAGVFELDSRPWWGPASIDISASAPSLPEE